jgi:16S rRNA (cytosine967-C5)-methyltransferase
MKHFSHLNTAVQLISQYKGEIPFSIFLKSFFAQHKKYGSKDRKRIGHLCYCYFRLGKSLQGFSVEERMLVALFLCDQRSDELFLHLKPEWNVQMQLSIEEKISIVNKDGIPFILTDIFPWKQSLSEGIDHEQFCRSFLIQPDLFLRLRPGYERAVKEKLKNAGISFNETSASCISLPNASKIDSIIDLDKEAVVQDLNSQNTGRFLDPERSRRVPHVAPSPRAESRGQTTPNVWDCCAASGGKSILAYDLNPDINLTVSDIRESIILNLKARFAKAGIKNYHAFVADLSRAESRGRAESRDQAEPRDYSQSPERSRGAQPNYDLIICDAPCSGSGTWSRTPEQLTFYDHEKSQQHYSSLQQKILTNAIPHLKPGGRLVYITCSVFKKENEDAAAFITNKFPLQPERMEILKGYDKRADTLFAASFIRID